MKIACLFYNVKKLFVSNENPNNCKEFSPFIGKRLYKDMFQFKGNSIIWFSENGVGEIQNTDSDWGKIVSA